MPVVHPPVVHPLPAHINWDIPTIFNEVSMSDFFKSMTLDNDRAWFYWNKEKNPEVGFEVLYHLCKLAKRRKKVFVNTLQQEKKAKAVARSKRSKNKSTAQELSGIGSAMDMVWEQVENNADYRFVPCVLISNFKGMDSILVGLGVSKPKEGKIVFTRDIVLKIFTHLDDNGCQEIFDRIHAFSQDRSNYSSVDEEQHNKDRIDFELDDEDDYGVSEEVLQVEEEKNS